MSLPMGASWSLMTWNQVMMLSLLSGGFPEGSIDSLIVQNQRNLLKLIDVQKLNLVPDFTKTRPWCYLLFAEDKPGTTYRYMISRSVSEYEKGNPRRYFVHSPESHSGHNCCIDSKAAIPIEDNEMFRLPVLLGWFMQKAPKSKSCNSETPESAAQIYELMSRSFPQRAKYLKRKLENA
jgi:hypothetical protein